VQRDSLNITEFEKMKAITECEISRAQIDDFERDGVICLRGVVSEGDVAMLRDEIKKSLEPNNPRFRNVTANAGNDAPVGNFLSSVLLWRDSPLLKNFTHNSNLLAFAGKLLRSTKVNLFFDQTFVKEPGAKEPTPWHTDYSHWPLIGEQILTFWIALDHITPESSTVEFVRGSHKWERKFQPESFSGPNKLIIDPTLEKVPDIEAEREKYDIVFWTLDPGDILVFNGRTLHGSQGNRTPNLMRRGYVIRYTGDDVVYDPRPTTTPALRQEDLVAGKPIDSVHYPTVVHS